MTVLISGGVSDNCICKPHWKPSRVDSCNGILTVILAQNRIQSFKTTTVHY